jgi:regulatory protein YycH of two-component signal transduction system YycFG
MHHRKTKVAGPTAATMTTITPQQQEEGQSSLPPSVSSCSPRRLKLYTPAEIEHCETSKTIMKYIEAKTLDIILCHLPSQVRNSFIGRVRAWH